MQPTITVTTVNGVPKVVDNNGNVITWVNLIYISLDPSAQPILYLGCTNFSATFNTGTATPAPSPAPAPNAAPSSAPAA